jgi:hypothetical protein
MKIVSKLDNTSLFGTENIDEIQMMYEGMTYGGSLPIDFSIADSMESELDWQLEEVIHMSDREFEEWLRCSLELRVR